LHEGDEPDSLVDFFDSEPLSSQDGWDVDLLAMQAEASAGGDKNVPVVKGISEFRQALIGRGEGV
jgi:hypothetical protein